MADLFDNNDDGAEFSKCGKYRYKLWRIWDKKLPLAMCIGLNPSTANASKNDPTIGYLRRMLSKLGYGGFYMMNLFAYISSKPEDLLTCGDPLGDNESKLEEVEAMCHDVVVCWGNFKQASERIKEVLPRYPEAKCFGVNRNGTPYHPLALMYNGTSGSPQLFLYSQLVETNNT
jgi:hypothetical protein